HFVGSLHAGLKQPEARLPLTGNIVQHNDGIVDQHPDAQRQAGEGYDVDRDIEKIENQQADQQRSRQADPHDQGDTKVFDKEKQYTEREERAEKQAGLQIGNGSIEQTALILRQLKVHLGVLRPKEFEGAFELGNQLIHLGRSLLV